MASLAMGRPNSMFLVDQRLDVCCVSMAAAGRFLDEQGMGNYIRSGEIEDPDILISCCTCCLKHGHRSRPTCHSVGWGQ